VFNLQSTNDLYPKQTLLAGALFVLNAHLCTGWYYPLYTILYILEVNHFK